MADNSLPPIVIKRKKAGHHGHHGGAWKVAYADFVTAMMAFFLLLWLLNVTTEEQKNGIADYFTPSTASDSVASGAGSILGGATITVPGSSVSESSPIAIADPIPTDGTNQESAEHEQDGGPTTDENQDNPKVENNPKVEENPKVDPGKPVQEANIKPNENQIDKAIEEREQKAFDEVAKELQEQIKSIPELAQLQKSLVIDQTPEGLRIQLIDQEGYSMFPRGSAIMADRTKQLIDLVARAIKTLPNKLSISGHTDSTPYVNPLGNYSNWELSSDRANAARRMLTNSGIDISRIATVVGRADRDHYIKDDPADQRNRRLSIILLRQALTKGSDDGDAAAPAPAENPANTENPHDAQVPAGP